MPTLKTLRNHAARWTVPRGHEMQWEAPAVNNTVQHGSCKVCFRHVTVSNHDIIGYASGTAMDENCTNVSSPGKLPT